MPDETSALLSHTLAVLRTLVEDGGASLTLAVSWCVTADDALDGLMPTQWLESGRDAARLLQVARQDAARLAQ
jgi:hypothetical protein